MNGLRLQSVAKRVLFKAFLASDHVTAATAKTIDVHISKNGAAFADPDAGATTATEISNGWYYVALGANDYDTLGELVVRGTEGTIDPAERVYDVVAATNAGLTNLDATISSRSTLGGTAQTGDSFARIGLNGAGLTALGDARLGNLDAAVSTRSTLGGVAQTGDSYALVNSAVFGLARLWKAVKNKLIYAKVTGGGLTQDHMYLMDDDDTTSILDHAMTDDAVEATRGRGA